MSGVKVTVRNRGEVLLEADVEPGDRVPIPAGWTFTSIEVDGYVYVYAPNDFPPGLPEWALRPMAWGTAGS